MSLEVPRLLMFSRDAGDSIMFQCRAQGSPLPDIAWFKDDIPIVPSGSRIQINSGTNLDSEGIPTIASVLTVSDLTPSDAGSYNCRASNSIASVSLQMPYVLSVTPVTIDYCSPNNPCQNGGRCMSRQDTFQCDCSGTGYTGITCDMEATTPTPPMVTTSPQSMRVPFSSQASFSCLASGNPQPDIQWFKDGSPISGETGSMLVIARVTLSDRGFYHCTATNTEGSDTSAQAVLNIQGIYQFAVPATIPITATGPFIVGEIPRDEVIMAISSIVDTLNDGAQNQRVGMNPEFIILNMNRVGSVITVSSTE